MLTAFVLLSTVLGSAPKTQDRIEPVNYRNVTIKDHFWADRQKMVRDVTMDEQFRMLDKFGYRSNFEKAAARQTGGYKGYVFNDSDVYKVLEAGAYVLGSSKDPKLEAKMDDWISLIARTQEADGYLDTHFQLEEPQNKWKNLRDNHELYCAGHLFEAAAAHYEATGKKTLLNVATKLADHIDARFGELKRMGYPGHPEAELALFKLWRATGEKRYYKLAEFFLNNRGSKWFASEHSTPVEQYDGTYWSDHLPIRDHEEIQGHAVRAAYLFSGATDLAQETRDPKLVDMLDRVWKNTTEKRMFITGGLGPSGSNEGFTVDYDLPTFTAYQESCASIANALWNSRMAVLHGDAKYADVMETALYNGTLAGISLSGDKYFYTNPLASHGDHHRQEWFGCACCPPNLARMIGQLGGHAYAASGSNIYVNLYVGGTAHIKQAGQDVDLEVKTNYPWDGKVSVKVLRVAKPNFVLDLRVPGWVDGGATLDGKGVVPNEHGYVEVAKNWKVGDTVQLELPMAVRKVVSNPNVKDTAGMFAFARGPVYYCVEQPKESSNLDQLSIPETSGIGTVNASQVVNNVVFQSVKLVVPARVEADLDWNNKLFQSAKTPMKVALTATPYSMWDNAGPSEMRVWFTPNPPPAIVRGFEKSAKVGLSFKSGYSDPEGVIDGYVPATSNPNSPRQTHFWPHKGGEETIALMLKKSSKLSSARVYWFDDTGRGEVRVPAAWRMEVKVNGTWTPVKLRSGQSYGLKLDTWNEIKFDVVDAQEARLVIQQQNNWSTGIHEWQLF